MISASILLLRTRDALFARYSFLKRRIDASAGTINLRRGSILIRTRSQSFPQGSSTSAFALFLSCSRRSLTMSLSILSRPFPREDPKLAATTCWLVVSSRDFSAPPFSTTLQPRPARCPLFKRTSFFAFASRGGPECHPEEERCMAKMHDVGNAHRVVLSQRIFHMAMRRHLCLRGIDIVPFSRGNLRETPLIFLIFQDKLIHVKGLRSRKPTPLTNMPAVSAIFFNFLRSFVSLYAMKSIISRLTSGDKSIRVKGSPIAFCDFSREEPPVAATSV